MGKTCEPKAFSFQCMTEFTTKKKKVEFLIKILKLCQMWTVNAERGGKKVSHSRISVIFF